MTLPEPDLRPPTNPIWGKLITFVGWTLIGGGVTLAACLVWTL